MTDEIIEGDVLVIGGGITALRAAVSAADSGADVVLVDKGIPSKSGGGPVAFSTIAALIEKPDSVDIFFEDLMRSGEYLNNPALARILASDVADGKVLEIEKYGIIFDRLPNNKPRRYQTGGHSYPRCFGSYHTSSIADVLLLEVMRRDICVIPEMMMAKLLTLKGAVVGAVGLNRKNGILSRI